MVRWLLSICPTPFFYIFVVGGWAHGHASGSKFYWASDVKDMAYKWGQLQKAVHMRVPGAKQKLEDFRSERKDVVRKVLEVALSLPMPSKRC
jgi:hypothetical protein